MKPCSALIEERRGAATPLHAYRFLPPNVKHIKLNVPANLTQLFVCCWGVRTCLCVCVLTLNGVHMSVYVQLSEHTQAWWCLHVRGGWRERERETEWAISLARPCGMRLHILQHIAEGWGNLLLSKIIGLLHAVISLIIMKTSLQFSNYYSMPILFLSNKEEHWCKTKCQDSISCLCLRAIQRWGTYTPPKYHPPIPNIKHLTRAP